MEGLKNMRTEAEGNREAQSSALVTQSCEGKGGDKNGKSVRTGKARELGCV